MRFVKKKKFFISNLFYGHWSTKVSLTSPSEYVWVKSELEISYYGVIGFIKIQTLSKFLKKYNWLWNYFRTLEYRIIYYRLIHQQILTRVLLFSPLFSNFQEVQLKSDRSSAQQYFVFVLCVFVAGNLINVLMCCSIKWSMYRYFFPGIAYNWNQNSTRLIE